jgi:hypothetical protein
MSFDTECDWEESANVKQSTVVSSGSYSENLEEGKKEEILTVNTACFLQNKGRSSTRDFFREVQSLHYAMGKKGSMQGPYNGAYKHYQSVL